MVALARMARVKRPGIHVVLTAPEHLASHADGVGEFLSAPLDLTEAVAMVVNGSAPRGRDWSTGNRRTVSRILDHALVR